MCSITAIFSGSDFVQTALGVTIAACLCVSMPDELMSGLLGQRFFLSYEPFLIYTLQLEEGNKIWVKFETRHHGCVKNG